MNARSSCLVCRHPRLAEIDLALQEECCPHCGAVIPEGADRLCSACGQTYAVAQRATLKAVQAEFCPEISAKTVGRHAFYCLGLVRKPARVRKSLAAGQQFGGVRCPGHTLRHGGNFCWACPAAADLQALCLEEGEPAGDWPCESPGFRCPAYRARRCPCQHPELHTQSWWDAYNGWKAEQERSAALDQQYRRRHGPRGRGRICQWYCQGRLPGSPRAGLQEVARPA